MKLSRHIVSRGFVPDVIKEEDFVHGDGRLGSRLMGAVAELVPDGQWDAFVPAFESQIRNGLETMNCTNYNTLKPLQGIMRRRFNAITDFSERYTGIGTGTTRQGNSPQKVVEIIRKEIGLIPDYMLPFSDEVRTWEHYYSPNPMRSDLLKIGKNFLKQYEIGHEWVFTSGDLKEKQERMMSALRFSPLGVSVVAWQEGSDGKFYKESGQSDNHWTTVVGFKKGDYWLSRDSYDGDKKLDWGYNFGMVKRYTVDQKAPIPNFCERIQIAMGFGAPPSSSLLLDYSKVA